MSDDPIFNLIAKARSLPLARNTISTFSTSAPLPSMREALARAVGETDIAAATALALAIGASGQTIDAAIGIRLLPDLESMAFFPAIAGIAEGDRLSMLLDVVEQGHLSWQRHALALFLATNLIEGEPPRRLIKAIRSLAREPIGHDARLLLSVAALVINDPGINKLTEDDLPLAEIARENGFERRLLDLFHGPVLDSLPEEAARVIASGFTAVRTEPKVGRNDPCPCGSGQKYKKCCAGKEQATSGRATLVERFQKSGKQHAAVRKQLFDDMRPGELARLDPADLTTLQLILGFRKLANHHRWEDAERFVDELPKRKDFPSNGSADEYRHELAFLAMEADQLDFAERQLEGLDLDENEAADFRLALALARKSPDALEQLESTLARAHQTENDSLLFDCVFRLIHSYPALGILAGRGAISRERLLDSDMILREIELARDKLELSAREPWWDVFDLLLDQGLTDHDPFFAEEKNEQVDEMRASLDAAHHRIQGLERELNNRVTELDVLTRERKPVPAQSHSHDSQASEEEARRLRTKISELKGEINEGAKQRAALRRELAETADALQKQQSTRAAETTHEEKQDDAEGEAATMPRRILVPSYSSAASRALTHVPQRVAADAMQITARLASGDAAAWSGVKHMRRDHAILSARVGRIYRLLFTLSSERLEVLELIHRRELETTIERLRR